MAAPTEIGANFMSNMLREQTFSEKQTSNDNFSNKTDPLSPAILDQDLSENVDHAGDTKADNADKAKDDKAKDDRNRNRNRNRKRIVILVILVISVIAVLALIGMGSMCLIIINFLVLQILEANTHRNSSKDAFCLFIKLQLPECKEYTNLACSLQSSSNKGPSQIFGGEIVHDRKMFPHQVHLLIKTRYEKIRCGGSLINENFVLTAAHCVYDFRPATMKVLVGSLNKQNQNETLWKEVKKTYIHPNHNSTGANPVADIALIELVGDVAFNSDIRPICLNTKLEKRYNSTVYATGWGRTETGDSSDDLKMVEVRIDDEADEYCRLIRQRYPPEKKELLEKTTICVAHFAGGGIHKGDSGGPLQVKLQSNCVNTWEQIGIDVSISGNYSGNLTFQHFAKVEYFIPWIVSVAWP